MQPSDSSILSLEIPELEISSVADISPSFRPILEQGFLVQISGNETVQNALCQQLGVAEKYLRDRVQTVFLNGKAVDDVDTAIVASGSKLALSAAMPGLVGITFRKGGFYAALRSSISYSKTDDLVVKGGGEIILKLFNMVAKELGPDLLKEGIRIEGYAFHHFMQRNAEDLKAAVTSVHFNDEEIDVAALLEMNWDNRDIFLKVASDQKS